MGQCTWTNKAGRIRGYPYSRACDGRFYRAAKTGTHRYDRDKIFEKALPYLTELKKAGCNTFIDCTPVYLGRDVTVLKRLAKASGLNIFTVTGYYGALKENFLPAHAYTDNCKGSHT